MRKVRWVKNMYDDVRFHRHSLGLQYIACDLDDVTTITDESLVFAVCRFITEVKKLDGSDFPGKSLYDITICMQFHLDTLGFSWRLLNDDVMKDKIHTG